MDNENKSLNWVLLGLALVLVVGFGVFLFLRGRGDDVDVTDDNDTNIEQDGDSDSDRDRDTNNDDSNDRTDDTPPTQNDRTVPTDFSKNTQKVGSSDDKEDSTYTLVSIEDKSMGDYHRFTFNLQSSTETELPLVEARLVSSGGYIRLRLDRVTKDQSGIAYQNARAINKDGIIRLYHDVSANQSEELYNVGIKSDTAFLLKQGEGLSVILDVAYPGDSSDDDNASSTGEFSKGNQTIADTNTTGTARIGTYTWAVEPTVLKFIWNTSASSGNPIPQTEASYDSGSNEIRVTFKNLQQDHIVSGFDTTLSAPVSKVFGEKSGTDSIYTFKLTKSTEYRIYKSLSPNQVVLEIKR